MVADRVELVTRKAGETEGVHWESTGEGSYTIEAAPDAPQGTSVTLHLKAEDAEDSLHDYANRVDAAADREEVLGLHHLAGHGLAPARSRDRRRSTR